MALLLPHHLRCSLLVDKHHNALHLTSPAKPKPIRRHGFVPNTSKSAIDDDPPAADVAQSKKPISSGQGFGPNPGPVTSKKKAATKERGAVTRRNPVARSAFLDKKDGELGKEQALTETAFLLTWLGLSAFILTEGIVLAASGFLPHKWDNFLVKYLYPSFTPTVALFVTGTVAYSVLKYLHNENAKISK